MGFNFKSQFWRQYFALSVSKFKLNFNLLFLILIEKPSDFNVVSYSTTMSCHDVMISFHCTGYHDTVLLYSSLLLLKSIVSPVLYDTLYVHYRMYCMIVRTSESKELRTGTGMGDRKWESVSGLG